MCFQLIFFCLGELVLVALVFVADVVPVDGFVADDEADDVCGVGCLLYTSPSPRD